MAPRYYPFGRGRDIGSTTPLDINNRGVIRPRGAGGNMAPPADVGGQRIAPTRVASISPATEYPIPSAQLLFAHAQALTLPAGAGSSVAGPSFQLPAGNVAVINGITIFVNAPDTTTDIFYSVLINGGRVQGYDQLSDFPRVANNLDRTFPAMILVPNGALIETLISNRSAAGPWTVGMDLVGWHMPERDVEMYTGIPFGRI